MSINITTIEEAVTSIIDWEIQAGESFVDYFMHDNIDDGAWAYWLLARGYVKHANNIIMELLAGEKNLDQEVLYHVYDENDEDPHVGGQNMVKNINLMAEFLVETPSYLVALNKFLNNNQ